MAARPAYRSISGATLALRAAAFLCAALLLISPLALRSTFAQTNLSDTYKLTDEMKAKLVKEGGLTLRDANFVEAALAISRAWKVNIVVGNELKAETVSCEFVDAPLYEVLDTILGSRGYGYRPVGNSLVVRKLEAAGPHPLFQTATIPITNADPSEVLKAVSLYLSEHGQIEIVPSARRLMVLDFPDRLEIIEQKAREFDDAAKEIREAAIASGQGTLGSAGAMLPATPSSVAYFDLNHVKAETLVPSLQTVLSPLGRVTPVPKDNRLIIVDSEDRLKLVAAAIRQLDVPRPQIRIDALIYDASLEDVRRCGVNWNSVGKGNNINAAGIAQDQINLGALTAAAPAAGAANGALTLMSLGSNLDLHVVINMLAQSKDSRLLSDPSVIVYDQETASFEAVTEIPYQQLTQGLGGGSIGTTAFREAGTTLTVTPQVSLDQTITMLVNPRFSVLAGLTPQTNQPIIDRREARTTVRVRNAETLVIGGLRQRSAIKNNSKVPYLGDLKGVGHLFKDKQATVRESELIVFITPTIVDMGYLGTHRQECIHGASLPELETIPYPKIPEYPCPPDQWKHRCGLCNKHHSGKCLEPGPNTDPYVPPPYELLPPVPALPESAPTVSPTAPRLETAPAIPPEGSSRSGTRTKGAPLPTQGRTAAATKGAAKTTASKPVVTASKPALASSPSGGAAKVPLMTPATPVYVPLRRLEDQQPAASRLAAVAPAEEDMRRLPAVENESEDPRVVAPTGPKKLSPARPVLVAEQPTETPLR